MPTLSAGRSLDTTRHVRDRHARRLAKTVRARYGTTVDVRDAVLGAVLNVVSNVLFSEDVVGMRVQGGQLFMDLMVEVLQDWTRPNVSDAFPFLAPVDLLGSRRRVTRGLTKLYKFFDDEFIERRLASGDSHGDLLDICITTAARYCYCTSRITARFKPPVKIEFFFYKKNEAPVADYCHTCRLVIQTGVN